MDRLEDVYVVGLRGVPVPGGARVRTFVVPVAAVVHDRGLVLMVAVLWVEVEELCCWAPLSYILATAPLPYVPGRSGGKSGWWARHTTGTSLRGNGIPLHVR